MKYVHVNLVGADEQEVQTCQCRSAADPRCHRGRGASWSPANRFEKLHVHLTDPDVVDGGCETEETPRRSTQYFRDATRTIITHNTSPSTPPTDASAIQAVTPSDVFSWPGPAEHLTQSSERTGIENNWFALTGRVVAVKVEMDGDLHVALQDATGDKAGIVVCEIPAKQQWCSIRETVFSWTTTRFPFHTSSDRKLKLIGAPIITVTGKAYWDVGHAPKDQSNRRSHQPGYAAWEIHPVMKVEVLQ